MRTMLKAMQLAGLLAGLAAMTAVASADDLYSAKKFTSTSQTKEGYFVDAAPIPGQRAIRACIGDKVCPVAVAAMFPCGYTELQVATEVCTLYKADGSTAVLDHSIVHQGTHAGNKCGYDWFLVTCYPAN
ncbi:MAG: hypothetical protein WDM94_12350 [Bauldia sp.]